MFKLVDGAFFVRLLGLSRTCRVVVLRHIHTEFAEAHIVSWIRHWQEASARAIIVRVLSNWGDRRSADDLVDWLGVATASNM